MGITRLSRIGLAVPWLLSLSVLSAWAAVDRDADTRPDGVDSRFPAAVTSPGPPSCAALRPSPHTALTPDLCTYPCQTAIPYCDTAGRGALTLRPSVAGQPALLAWTTQTPFNDDIVWMCANDIASEQGRCCGRTQSGAINQTVVSLSYNDRIVCNLDSMYYGGATNSSGFVYESGLYPAGSPTSTRHCAAGDQGEDEIACATAACPFLRQFSFAGLDPGDIMNGVAVMDPPGVGPLLAASADAMLYFVDPASPSCTAPIVNVIGTCLVMDGATRVSPTGLAWAGGNELLAVSSATDQVYRIVVDFAASPLRCTIVDQCASPGPEPEAITYDPVANVVYVHDATDHVIYFQGDCAAQGCTVVLCGNGTVEAGEQCDDGNTDPGDGCRADCTIEVCGDGIVDPGEQCDDGNSVPGDGCTECIIDRCTLNGIQPIRLLLAIESADAQSVVMSFSSDGNADAYNVWYVDQKQLIPTAQQGGAGMTPPNCGPTQAASCWHFSAVPPTIVGPLLFYQVRGVCAGVEAPQ